MERRAAAFAPSLLRLLIPLVCLALASLTPTPTAAQEPSASDRIVAVVDGDPILESDLRRAIALRRLQDPARAASGSSVLRREVLNELIEQRLRYHEVDRFGFDQIPDSEVEEAVEALRSEAADAASFDQRLTDLGLTPKTLRDLIARQLLTLAFVEERLGARVFVDLADIQTYYDGELKERMDSEGLPMPRIQEIREEIRQLLRQRRLNSEIERWTQELWEQADVLDYLDDPRAELPPVVRRLRPSATDGSSSPR